MVTSKGQESVSEDHSIKKDEATRQIIQSSDHQKNPTSPLLDPVAEKIVIAETQSAVSSTANETEIHYIELVDRLNITLEQKEKLEGIVTGYEEAVETAKELDPNVRVPSKEQVITHLIALGSQKLEKIATIMGKPDLIIEPDMSFEQIKDAMDAHRHYDGQNECNFDPNYEWSGNPGKVRVSIIDMVQNPAVIPEQRPQEQYYDEQLRKCEEYFRGNGMSLITDRQFAVGMQKSLRAYEHATKKGESNPEKYILDFYSRPNPSLATMFNQEHNRVIKKGVMGYFSPRYYRAPHFLVDHPRAADDYFRGRGAVQVMEF